MRGWSRTLSFSIGGWVGLAGLPSAMACSACFGASDSRLAVGMNWGIATLLGVVLCVLGGLAAFFIYLAKRSAMVGEADIAEPSPETKEKV